MSTLLESLASTIDADAIAGIGKALGTDGAAVTKGLGAIAPLLLNSMSKMAGTPGGADSLLKMLPESGGVLGSLGSLFKSAFGSGTGAGGTLSSLLGPGFNSIAASLSRSLGFNVAPLITAVAPALLGAIAKAVKSQGLDASGLASLLAKEQAAFTADPANQEALALAASAADAGNQATAMIASYGADWAKVAAAPAAALFAVASADPSGPMGSIKEASAAGEKLREIVKGAAPTSLVAAAFGAGLTPDMLGQLKSVAPTKDKLVDTIRAGAAAVAAKSPAEAQAYRSAILAVAQAAAEASKEGGFLGIGGTLVSKDEQGALDQIKAALG